MSFPETAEILLSFDSFNIVSIPFGNLQEIQLVYPDIFVQNQMQSKNN